MTRGLFYTTLFLLISTFCIALASAESLNTPLESYNSTSPQDKAALTELYNSLIQQDERYNSSINWEPTRDPCFSYSDGDIKCTLGQDGVRIIGLKFKCNFFSPNNSVVFPEALNNLTALQNFTSESCIIKSYPNMSSLTALTNFVSTYGSDFYSNRYPTPPTLPEGVKNVTLSSNMYRVTPILPQSVEYLDLSDNYFSDLSTLFNKTLYPHLTTLIMKYASGIDPNTLPMVTKYPTESVSNIQFLNLDHSPLGVGNGSFGPFSFLIACGELIEIYSEVRFPPGYGLPTYLPSKLTSLTLYRTGLNGTLPAEWAEFTSLQTINLYHNLLIGEIPSSWANLTNLKVLDLSSNRLNGTPPEWIHQRNVDFTGNCNSWSSVPEWCPGCGSCGSSESDGGDNKKKLLWLLVIPFVCIFLVVGVAVGVFFIVKRRNGSGDEGRKLLS